MQFKKYIPRRHFQHFLSSPFIYGMIVPCVFLDITMEVYHRICFPIYGLKYVKRGEYIRVDRQKLSYLNWLEKFNCMYCGYVNGLMHYASAIGARSEEYWCGIMHSKKNNFRSPLHHKDFLTYGDEKAFREFEETCKK